MQDLIKHFFEEFHLLLCEINYSNFGFLSYNKRIITLHQIKIRGITCINIQNYIINPISNLFKNILVELLLPKFGGSRITHPIHKSST